MGDKLDSGLEKEAVAPKAEERGKGKMFTTVTASGARQMTMSRRRPPEIQ